MKRFRIRESFIVKGWTYVEAEDAEEAQRLIEAGEGRFEETSEEHNDTKWKTFEEIEE